jgi:hypothetical protein
LKYLQIAICVYQVWYERLMTLPQVNKEGRRRKNKSMVKVRSIEEN